MNIRALVKPTLLFSACFISVALLLVREHSVGALSARGFGLALAFWCVGGSLAFVFGLVIFAMKRAAPSPEAMVATHLAPASRRQRAKLALTLRFYALYISVFVLIFHEFRVGNLSGHGLGTLTGVMVAIYVGAYYLVLVFGLVNSAKKQAEATGGTPLDPETRQKRIFAIRVLKGIIALLVFGLLKWLSNAENFPVWGMLLGATVNLTLMASMVWGVMQLQKSLK